MKTPFTALYVSTVVGLACSQLNAQVLLSGGSYQQDFDTLVVSGTPNNWADNSTLNGWYADAALGTTIYRAGTGSSTTGSLYSFGSSGTSERALGSVATDSTGPFAYGVRFLNDTGQSLSDFMIEYTGEQWRATGAGAQSLGFSYRVSDSAATELDLGNSLSWVAVSGLDFVSPRFGGSTGALDGNAAGNRTAFLGTPLSGLVLSPGQELFLRWTDPSDPGSDHGLGIDNLRVEFSAVPEPGSCGLMFALGLGVVAAYREFKRARGRSAVQTP
jgi:hypothetical protein